MPAKKTTLTDEERARRIRELAEQSGTDENPEAFERAFKAVLPTENDRKSPAAKKCP